MFRGSLPLNITYWVQITDKGCWFHALLVGALEVFGCPNSMLDRLDLLSDPARLLDSCNIKWLFEFIEIQSVDNY